MFYGILILMYFYDDKKHSRPHIHAEYGEFEASIAIDDGTVLGGNLPWWIGNWPSRVSLYSRLIRCGN
jgi:hypothetical protein